MNGKMTAQPQHSRVLRLLFVVLWLRLVTELFAETGFYQLPVDDGPKSGEIIRTAVLVVKVVGMLPHVEGKDGAQSVAQRVVRIGHLQDREVALGIGAEPSPSASEESGGGGIHAVLHLVEGAEASVDSFQKASLRLDNGWMGNELLEIEDVVEHLASVVADASLSLSSHLLEGGFCPLSGRDEVVEIVHVCLQMLAIVKVDGLLADNGGESSSLIA